MSAIKQFVFVFILILSLQDAAKAQNPEERMLINLGPNINTAFLEINPRVSGDNKTLYFVREEKNEGKRIQEIWISRKDSIDQWLPAERLEKPLNTSQSNSVVSVSEDGSQLLIKGFYKKGKIRHNGYSFVRLGKQGWDIPEGLVIDQYKKMDKGLYNNACISNDYKVLIFSFSASKKILDNDLYVSVRKEDGTYSQPVKLGANINVAGQMEFASYIAPDNKTLYFTSDKPGGLGATDIYKTERLDDTWLKWSDPVNLGEKVNGSGRDGYYTLNSEETHAYMISDHDSLGNGDIVMIVLKTKPKPQPKVLIKGNILDAKTKNPLAARVEYQLYPADTLNGEIQTDSISGNYNITLPYSEKYIIATHLHGYVTSYDTVTVQLNGDYMEIVKDFNLAPIVIGEKVVLNHVNFETNSSILTIDSFDELNKVTNLLLQNPEVKILIGGHTDNNGKAEKNRILSDERAKAVMNYIVSKGVSADRLQAKGYGQTEPVAANTTEENKRLNRRVEFTITEE